MIFERKLGIYFDTKKIFLTAIFNNGFSNFGGYISVSSASVSLVAGKWHLSALAFMWLFLNHLNKLLLIGSAMIHEVSGASSSFRVEWQEGFNLYFSRVFFYY